jgi:hypothetical protein
VPDNAKTQIGHEFLQLKRNPSEIEFHKRFLFYFFIYIFFLMYSIQRVYTYINYILTIIKYILYQYVILISNTFVFFF